MSVTVASCSDCSISSDGSYRSGRVMSNNAALQIQSAKLTHENTTTQKNNLSSIVRFRRTSQCYHILCDATVNSCHMSPLWSFGTPVVDKTNKEAQAWC
ncbi:hypothetical protein DPMN_117065 [Dreissena polymorpha]|uniref:Uncharacterized protein n=1 Tax=Dreissena polymorpha TaxID=45954 RepID=A0A9D4KP61_DREPO|nr:hypothetical protein DPMN_117064 [Dreissena polymorpha]KAH3843545.1 hypothetical protein DPMN_117065 [Dreissena polymorpha]